MIKNKLDQIVEFIGINKAFLAFWLGCLVLVAIIQVNIKESSSFVGVVSSRAHEVSTSSSSRVLKIHVLPGQKVKNGQLLVELRQDELEMKISRLNSQLTILKDEEAIVTGLSDQDRKMNPQIQSLNEQLKILKKAQRNLFIFSEFDGKVGAINYKEGEVVSPYSAVITIQEENATTVNGYIHESQFGEVALNQNVLVSSLVGGRNKALGIIVSVGSSMVNFPERLLKDPARPVWGREVVIKLKKENTFLLGEKVFIDHKNNSSFFKKSLFNESLASEDELAKLKTELDSNKFKLIKKKEVLFQKKFEASGIVYLEDLKKYLVVSDNKKKKDGVNVLFVSEEGEVSYTVDIPYLNEMRDVESVTLDSKGNLYFLSSLSKGKKRKSLLVVQRKGLNFSIVKKVSLFDKITEAVSISSDEEMKELLIKKNKLNIDIEGMIVKDNMLYLGLRQPLTVDKEAIILKINDLESLVSNDQVEENQLSIWKKIRLENDKRSLSISGLAFCSDHIYVAAAPGKKKGKYGALYRINHNQDDSYIDKILDFSSDKPEGIFFDEKRKSMAISFDNGNDRSKVIFYEL